MNFTYITSINLETLDIGSTFVNSISEKPKRIFTLYLQHKDIFIESSVGETFNRSVLVLLTEDENLLNLDLNMIKHSIAASLQIHNKKIKYRSQYNEN